MQSKSTKNPIAREVKAIALVESGAVQLRGGFALVASGTRDGVSYRVTKNGCTCPDATYRQRECCHVIAAKIVCAKIRRERGQHSGAVA